MKSIVAALFTFFFTVSALAGDTEGYTFVLDGKPFEPRFQKVNGEALSAGDVVYVGNLPLCLDEPGRYEFQIKAGTVYRVMDDGKSEVVACDISAKYDDALPAEVRFKSQPEVINPIANLDAVAMKAVRGISVGIWTEGVEKVLARLDMGRVCLRLRSNAIMDRVPPLPAGVRTLIVDSGGSWHCKDMSGFARLKRLRFLALNESVPEEFDFSVLRGLPLEYLSLPWASKPTNVDVLSTFSELKTLAADYCSYMGDGRWIGKLSNLRVIYASHLRSTGDDAAPALDLAALAGLAKLEEMHVQSTPIKTMPNTLMPSLKRSSLLLSGAPKEMMDAFAKANPQASISRSMNTQLADQLEKANRVLVRTGGVCHRREAEEKTLFESRAKEEIAELAAHFSVDESDSGGHCMCCGDPTFEFYDHDKRVAMIGFHHGRSIRWADGTWPGDGMLTSQSASFLVEWLAAHHYTGPQEQLLEGRRQAAAQRRRSARYAALLPRAVSEALNKADSIRKATDAFEKNVVDDKSRATLYLRLFGCDDGTWSLSTGMDQALVETWLPSIPAETLRDVILKVPLQSEEGLGAARWVFGEGHEDVFKNDENTLLVIAQFALTHPRQSNRWRTLAGLRDLGTPTAIQLLRSVMENGTKPRKINKEQETEAGGQMTFYPNAISLPNGLDDSVAAALCLTQLSDQPSQSKAKVIKDALTEEARKAWDKNLESKK